MAVNIGDSVVFVDPYGKDRSALVTAVHGDGIAMPPSLNVVYVNDDENQTDTYGRKTERSTSVPHKANQSANGYFWK